MVGDPGAMGACNPPPITIEMSYRPHFSIVFSVTDMGLFFSIKVFLFS